MPLTIVRDDITKMKVDAIVNAANTTLQPGSGVCGAIYQAAGAAELSAECRRIGYCPTGRAILTEGYQLPAGHIIHTAGPIWRGGTHGEPALLAGCYRNSLILARNQHFSSIAFPLVSSGVFGCPKDEALQIAIDTMRDFLMEYDMDIYLVIHDKTSFELSKKLSKALRQYIDEHYVEETSQELRSMDTEEIKAAAAGPENLALEQALSGLDATFSETVLRLIDEKGKTDVEVYKKANLDRKLFSKIRNTKDYRPSRATALALAIALELNLEETGDLLKRAGYALSHSNKLDLILEYFIEQGVYNIFDINEALFAFDQPLLGA